MFRKEGNNIYWFVPSRLEPLLMRKYEKKREKRLKKYRKKLKNHEFTIFSNNCLGGQISHNLGCIHRSPLVYTFIDIEDFYKFLLNPKYYINSCELKEFKSDEDYPIGILGDIKIQFVHYSTFSDAKNKWEYRKKRINWDNIYVIISDVQTIKHDKFCEIDLTKKLLSLNYKKIFISNDSEKKDIVGVTYMKRHLHNKPFYPNSRDLFFGRTIFEMYVDVTNFLNK